jgi:hypothetical protein
MAADPDAARAAFEASLQRAIANNPISKPGGELKPSDSIPPSLESPLAAAGSSSPEPGPPVNSTPQRPESDIERTTRVNSTPPPANYLKPPDEPWRKFVNQDGIIAGPWGSR